MQNVFSFCFFCLKSYAQNQKNHRLFSALIHPLRIDTESATYHPKKPLPKSPSPPSYHKKNRHPNRQVPTIIPPKKHAKKVSQKKLDALAYPFLHKKKGEFVLQNQYLSPLFKKKSIPPEAIHILQWLVLFCPSLSARVVF